MPAYFVVKLNVMPLILSLHTYTHEMAVKSPPRERDGNFFPLKNKEKHQKMMNNQVGGGRI
jgi:hypothetical protein